MSRSPSAAPNDFVGSCAAVCEAILTLRGDALHAELGRIAAVLLASPHGAFLPEPAATRAAPEGALVRRAGRLGQRLCLVEGRGPTPQTLAATGLDAATWWDAALDAYRWAIQVARNV